MNWRRDQIDLGMRFAREDSATIYEVVAIADQPTVVLRRVTAPGQIVGGDTDLHYVIGAPLFAEWRKVSYEGP